MKRFLTYDLETTFLQKGQKRPSQRIFEIALYTPDKEFHKMVNPCDKYSTAEELIESLTSMKQHVAGSLRFWSKLLAEKGVISSHFKRSSIETQAKTISKLLVRSETAKKQSEYTDYTSEQWLYALENHHDNVKVSKQYLDKYESNETPKSLLFHTTKEALAGALKFGHDFTWIAHNGKSFDMPIIQGNSKRCELKDLPSFEDSLPMFRKKLISDKFSQPYLYQTFIGKPYKAHHALHDAKALYELLEYTQKVTSNDMEGLFKVKKLARKVKLKSDLLTMKGIGQKSLATFKSKGVHTKKDLKMFVKKHTFDEFKETFKGVYRYKKLAEELYNTALI